VPFAAGGPVDTIARIVGAPRGRRSDRPSWWKASSERPAPLASAASHAPPRRYTLSIGHWGTHVVNGAVYPLSYDLLNDLEPVAMIASNPLMIVAKRFGCRQGT